MKLRLLGLLLVNLLGGCAEGGIGGTGSIMEPIPPIGMQGQGNKGPFEQGSTVEVFDTDGELLDATVTTGQFGEFEIFLEQNQVARLRVSGTFFSETLGAVSTETLGLDSVVVGTDLQGADVNVATHLINRRVLTFIEGGILPDVAQFMAQNELIAAISVVLPAPLSPLRFNELILFPSTRENTNAEGNAWLLALSAVIERVALDRMETDGGTLVSNLEILLDVMSTDFADDGVFDQPLVAELDDAVTRVNPDAVHSGLLALGDQKLREVLRSQTSLEDVANFECQVFGSKVFCAERLSESMLSTASFSATVGAIDTGETFALVGVVADMNRFIDTDRDGQVNLEDEDDDDDGTPDDEDGDPYGA